MAVYRVLASQRDLEYVSATVHHAEPVLVVGACDVGHRDIEGAISVASSAEPFGLAPDAIDTASPLLQGRRVPREVVVDDVATLAVKVDTLLTTVVTMRTSGTKGVLKPVKSRSRSELADRARHAGDDVAVPARLVVGGNLFLETYCLLERLEVGIEPFPSRLAGRWRGLVTPVNERGPVVISSVVVDVASRAEIVQNEPGQETPRADHATEHARCQRAESSGQPRQRGRVPAREQARDIDVRAGEVGGERRLTRATFEHVLPSGDVFGPCVMAGDCDVLLVGKLSGARNLGNSIMEVHRRQGRRNDRNATACSDDPSDR